jgi:hypothetical protein
MKDGIVKVNIWWKTLIHLRRRGWMRQVGSHEALKVGRCARALDFENASQIWCKRLMTLSPEPTVTTLLKYGCSRHDIMDIVLKKEPSFIL